MSSRLLFSCIGSFTTFNRTESHLQSVAMPLSDAEGVGIFSMTGYVFQVSIFKTETYLEPVQYTGLSLTCVTCRFTLRHTHTLYYLSPFGKFSNSMKHCCSWKLDSYSAGQNF